MTPYLKALPLILSGVLLNAFAQIAMKKGLQAAGGLNWNLGSLVQLGLEPWTLVCFACYAVSIVLWAGALNLVEVNFAYPFLALGFLANALMCQALLGESIPPLRWLALGLIILGVTLQAFTGTPRHL
ncbi:MAG: 4-amino-4-deoxy-L-arabinose transferase [Holophaga sp.]|jgi:multidrug transporter EmrE-like cation transporter